MPDIQSPNFDFSTIGLSGSGNMLGFQPTTANIIREMEALHSPDSVGYTENFTSGRTLTNDTKKTSMRKYRLTCERIKGNKSYVVRVLIANEGDKIVHESKHKNSTQASQCLVDLASSITADSAVMGKYSQIKIPRRLRTHTHFDRSDRHRFSREDGVRSDDEDRFDLDIQAIENATEQKYKESDTEDDVIEEEEFEDEPNDDELFF